MKRGRRILLIVAACGVLAVFAALLWPSGEREPVYQGKKLSEWIYGASAEPMRTQDATNRANAVRQIGSNGLPFLVNWIRDGAKISKVDSVLNVVARRVPGPLFTPRFRNSRLSLDAVWAFQVMGETARPAIPELVKLSQGNNAFVSTVATFALFGIGTNAAPALLEIPADFQARGRATNSARVVAPEVLDKGAVSGKPD